MPIGLCETCRHHECIESAKGSTFHMCKLGQSDAGFDRYPKLPVTTCAGFDRRAGDDSSIASGDDGS